MVLRQFLSTGHLSAGRALVKALPTPSPRLCKTLSAAARE
jgi:hypothetical protein